MTFDSVEQCVDQLRYWMEKVVLAAQLQGMTERQFERLIVVARAGIVLVKQVQAGDRVSQEWIIERDILVQAAAAIIDELPDKKERGDVVISS